MYSFCYLEPVCCSTSSSDLCFLTCIQVSQEAGPVVWYFHLLQNFSQFFNNVEYMWRTDLLAEILMQGNIEGRRRRGNRGWDVWMASPTQWTWVWACSGSWRQTGKPGMLQSMGWQKVRHDWDWTELNAINPVVYYMLFSFQIHLQK